MVQTNLELLAKIIHLQVLPLRKVLTTTLWELEKRARKDLFLSMLGHIQVKRERVLDCAVIFPLAF